MTITQIAIKRSTLVVVIFTTLAILGLACYTMLNYDLFPKMEVPVVVILTQYPGASANEVESSVTKKLEDALSSLEKSKDQKSTSSEGYSMVQIELESGTEISVAAEQAQRKINSIQSSLPVNCKTPSLFTFSMDDLPIMKFGVTGKMEPTKLYTLTDNQIKARLSKVEGVGQVTLIGGSEREIKVNIFKDKLDVYKVSISQVYQAISTGNLEFPTGKIEGDRKQYTIRLAGKVKSLEDIKNLIVSKTSTGSLIKISDIAEVTDGIAEQKNLNRINGENSIGIQIQKQSDANSVKVSKLVKQELALMEKEYADKEIKFNIAMDNSTYTLASANAVMEDLMTAILLVAIVMFFFLHSIRNSFIVLISIPASIVSVFIAMYVLNFSLNMLTLLALSLVIGILVDDSIVVLENIYRHLEKGKDRVKASLDGRSEIGFSALAITMVDVVVFLPLSLVSGMIGNLLREFSLVVVFSTLMSLFVSFTVTPLLASRFSKIEKLTKGTLIGKFALWFEGMFNRLQSIYELILRKSLSHKKIVYLSITVLIIGSLGLLAFGFIGTEFIPSGDRSEFTISLEGEPQNTLYQTNMLTKKVEDLIQKKPEVVKIFTNVGYSSATIGGSSEQNKSEITVTLVDKKKRKQSVEEYAVMVKKEIQEIPGLKVQVTPASLFSQGTSSPIQILLQGSDIEKIYGVADEIMKIMNGIPGATDIKLSVDKSKPEMQIVLNREKMAQLGLSVNDIGNTMSLAFSGNTNLQYSENNQDYDINVKFDQFDRKKVDDVGSITFMNNKGELIELRQFAEIYQTMGPSKLERNNRITSLTVNASVVGRPVGTVGEEIKEAVKNKIHNNEVTILYKGQLQFQTEAFSSLLIALIAAILFVYFVMVALYNSYMYPFIVLFSIPVAMIGAFLALALSGQNFSIFSIIGMIMLLGLVAKNAILIVDFTNQLREKGKSIVEALVEAGKERLRPILMTTLAMVFGMLPIALATSEAAEVKNGLAWAIIGGLTSSLLLTLILVPSVYLTFVTIKMKLSAKFAKGSSAVQETKNIPEEIPAA
jgi:hydrophobic/amphiphilic exporter-1 (mainly G- bacteria), HAE1 family